MKCIYIKRYGKMLKYIGKLELRYKYGANSKNFGQNINFRKKIVHFWNLFVTQNPDIERLNYNKTFLPDNAIILLESKI